MSLTNLQVKQAKPKEKAYKLADAKGMYLFINSKGQKYWRMDYRYGGKRKTLALGVYPDISLSDARDRRDNAKQQLQNDINPTDVKRAAKLAKTQAQENSFKAVALEWFEKEKPHWSDSHTVRMERMLKKNCSPISATGKWHIVILK